MALRTGSEYLRSLNDGRKVFLDGEPVADVSRHKAFREAARSVARLYDIAAEPANRELMTFTSPKTNEPVLRAYQTHYKPFGQTYHVLRQLESVALKGRPILSPGGTLVSAMFGLLVSHVRDVYFLMITLALGMVLWGVSYRWIPVTGGDNGISGIPRLEATAGLPIAGPLAFYYVMLAVFAACGALMALFVASPFGFTLKGIRENESRMKSLGFNTWLHCYLSYVVSGAFASVAGVAWAYYNGFVSPTYLDLTASSELFLMVTLGGPGTLVGPAFGAGAIVLLKNVISGYTQRWLLILGAVYILTILCAPQGLWNLSKRREG